MTFVPQLVTVSDISQTVPCVVTTADDHNFRTGEAVRLKIPPSYGMNQLNNSLNSIRVLTDVTFALYKTFVPTEEPVDAREFYAFIPGSSGVQPFAMCVGSFPVINDLGTYFETKIDDQTLNNSTQPIPF